MKSILLHIDGDNCLPARLQVALDIARATNGHITCLQPVNYEIFAPGDFYGSALAAAIPRIREAAENLRAEIEAQLSNEDVSWEWQFVHGMAEDRLLDQSALHDLILVGPNDKGEASGGRPSALAGGLAIRAPVPVMVVPGHMKGFDVAGPAFVAWNGSSEACVALRAAVPLLMLADKVVIASVSEAGAKERLAFRSRDAARYLARYGVEPEVQFIDKGDAKVSDALFAAAGELGCGLFVMGAYGHSRLAEMLLGGVTRRSLTDPQLPIFMAH